MADEIQIVPAGGNVNQLQRNMDHQGNQLGQMETQEEWIRKTKRLLPVAWSGTEMQLPVQKDEPSSLSKSTSLGPQEYKVTVQAVGPHSDAGYRYHMALVLLPRPPRYLHGPGVGVCATAAEFRRLYPWGS